MDTLSREKLVKCDAEHSTGTQVVERTCVKRVIVSSEMDPEKLLQLFMVGSG